MSKKASVYQIGDVEIHFPADNECVCVCWNTRFDEREGDPYINFITLRQYGDEYCIDEDSPVRGGIGIDFARQIAQELEVACRYLKQHLESSA